MAIDSVRDCRLEIPPVPARCHAGSARPPNFSLVPRFAFSQCRCPLPIVSVRGGQPRSRCAMALARGRRRNSASQGDFFTHPMATFRHTPTKKCRLFAPGHGFSALLHEWHTSCSLHLRAMWDGPCIHRRKPPGNGGQRIDGCAPDRDRARHPPGEAGSDGLARPRGRPGRAEQEQQLIRMRQLYRQ